MNYPDDTPTPERVTLTDYERHSLADALTMSADPWEWTDRVHEAVEQILTARRAAWEAEVKAQVKADIYARNDSGLDLDNLPEWDDSCMSHDEAWAHGLADAARIAGGDQ